MAPLFLKQVIILAAGLLVFLVITPSTPSGAVAGSTQTVAGTPVPQVFLPYVVVPPATDTPAPTETATTVAVIQATPTPLPASCAPTHAGWTTVACLDFEGTFPDPFHVFDDNGGVTGDYEFAPTTCQAFQGTHAAWAIGGGTDGSLLACDAVYPNNVNAWMLYGPVDLTQATAAELTFKLWLNTEQDHDYLCRYASTDGIDYFGTCTSGSTSGWVDETLDLTNVYTLGNLTGQSAVWVAIVFTSDTATGLAGGAYVDNVMLQTVGGTVVPLVQPASRSNIAPSSRVGERNSSTRKPPIVGTPTPRPPTRSGAIGLGEAL